MECGEPEPGLNVNLITENPTYRFPSTLEYICLILALCCGSGSLNITCQNDGQWSGQVPKCSEFHFLFIYLEASGIGLVCV